MKSDYKNLGYHSKGVIVLCVYTDTHTHTQKRDEEIYKVEETVTLYSHFYTNSTTYM